MSRSDTFDSDVLEPDPTPPPLSLPLPWISAPVLQNTTCQVLLDPRKLLCESSSIVALIPCQAISPSVTPKSPQRESTVKSAPSAVSDTKPDTLDLKADIPLNVFQSDLLSEILSSADALQLLGSDISILSPSSTSSKIAVEKQEEKPVCSSVSMDSTLSSRSDSSELEISSSVLKSSTADKDNSSNENSTVDNVKSEIEKSEALTAWCFEGDDGFRDVIEAINRLCDTMSNSGSNMDVEDDASTFSFPERNDNVTERITEQPKTKNREIQNSAGQLIPSEGIFSENNTRPESGDKCSTCVGVITARLPLTIVDSIDSLICPRTPESASTPEVTADDVVNADSSTGDSSSPAVIEDDSSTNQTDLLQFSMCSSSLNNEDSALFLSTDGHLPNPEEVPPPGHVAAMRVKFETITNVSTMRLLRKSDDET